jgi:hypothetical protein
MQVRTPESLRGSGSPQSRTSCLAPGRRHSDLAGWLGGALHPRGQSIGGCLCGYVAIPPQRAPLTLCRLLHSRGHNESIFIRLLCRRVLTYSTSQPCQRLTHHSCHIGSRSSEQQRRMASAALKQLLAAATGDAEQGAWGALGSGHRDSRLQGTMLARQVPMMRVYASSVRFAPCQCS